MTMLNVQRLSDLRKRVIDRFGVAGVHALEDGGTVGLVLGLGLTFPPAAVVLLGVLGLTPSRAGPIAMASEITGLVREDARRQESYLAFGFVFGAAVGVLTGTVLRSVSVLQSIPIPV